MGNAGTQPIRILLADDHPVVLEGMAALLEADPRFQVVARCKDGAECMTRIRDLDPDVALVDVAMPALTGLQVLDAVRREGLRARVALLTATQNPAEIAEACRAGAWGVLLKDTTTGDMLETLAKIGAGKRALAPLSVDEAPGSQRRARPHSQVDDCLSAREREVVRLVGQGLSNKAIADRLCLSEGTVKNHLHNIYQKLGVANRTELALRAASGRAQ